MLEVLDYSKAKLPSGASWITRPPQAATMFALDPCPECDHRVIFCLDGAGQTYYPNNSACSNSFSIEEIFPAEPKSSKADFVRMPFQPDETSKKLTSDRARELAKLSAEARKRNKASAYYNVEHRPTGK
jgi:hypothetical protein